MALPKLETPKYKCTVPSTGKEIEYRPYLVKEEKMLMLASEGEDTAQIINTMKDLIKACTFEALNVESMTMFDMEFLFTKLRSVSVGENSKVGIDCKKCQKPNDVNIKLGDVKVNINKDQDMKIELTDKVGMVMQYPSVNAMIDAQAQSNGESDVDDFLRTVIASIESIYSADEVFAVKDTPKSEVDDFIDSLSSNQFVKIREFMENLPQAKIDYEFKCIHCEAINKNQLAGAGNFS